MRKCGKQPTTLDEAIKAFQEVLTPDEQIEITRMSKDELIECHHGLGQWIRNNWGLWAGGPLLDHMKSLGFTHPDDMSSSLIKEYWVRMNQQPSEIDEDIKEYKEFWTQTLRKES